MRKRFAALALACSFVGFLPTEAVLAAPFGLSLFGPSAETTHAFAAITHALDAYEQALSAGRSMHNCQKAAADLFNSVRDNEAGRQHPDYAAIRPRIVAVRDLYRAMEASGVYYHPALGVLTPEEARGFEKVATRTALSDASPEAFAEALGRLDALTTGTDTVLVRMAHAYRKVEVPGRQMEAVSEFLVIVAEDFVRLANTMGSDAVDDGQALVIRLKALQKLGVRPSDEIRLAGIGSPKVSVATMLATATARAEGQPATDAASRQALEVQIQLSDGAAALREFEHTYLKGRAKAKALIVEYGYPTKVLTGPNNSWLWEYHRWERRGGVKVKRVKTLTVSKDDGHLIEVKDEVR